MRPPIDKEAPRPGAQPRTALTDAASMISAFDFGIERVHLRLHRTYVLVPNPKKPWLWMTPDSPYKRMLCTRELVRTEMWWELTLRTLMDHGIIDRVPVDAPLQLCSLWMSPFQQEHLAITSTSNLAELG